MTYLEIRKLIADNNLVCDIKLEIVDCVLASLDSVNTLVDDDMFNAICSYVYNVWSKADKGYTQLISDVVVDCVYHCFDYYQCKGIDLTYDDLIHLNHYRDTVMTAYLEKFYD